MKRMQNWLEPNSVENDFGGTGDAELVSNLKQFFGNQFNYPNEEPGVCW